jgi:hypothetical protein
MTKVRIAVEDRRMGNLLADFLEFHILTGNPPLVTAVFPSEMAHGRKKMELLGQRRVSKSQLRRTGTAWRINQQFPG